MAVYEFEGKRPVIGRDCYIFESAALIGSVSLGDNVFVGPGAVLRGDYGRIEVGDRSSVEDNCVLHARPEQTCRVGRDVTLGHGAIVHTASVGDWTVVGMGAIISDFAAVGEWCVIGEGAVVKNRSEIPPRKVAVGVPAKPVADVSDDYIAQWTSFKRLYNELAARRYPTGLKRVL